MVPAFWPGDIVLIWRGIPRVGQVAFAKPEDREVIKRVERIERGKYFLVGDNADDSTDSRHYGPVKKSAILGTIVIGFPAATPPAASRPFGVWLGRLTAVLLASMALVHLFRIDTFLPLLDAALPSGSGFATFVGLLVIFSEVFAIPFALRMSLSPLAHAVSGALVAFAPLWWVIIDIMTVGLAENTGQLGEFVTVPSTLPVLALNMIWFTLSFIALYALGYNRLKPQGFLRK